MGRRQRAIRLGLPALFVAILTFIALWRVGAPIGPTDRDSATARATPLDPLTHIAEVLADNSIGRRASLERVVIREVTSARTLWIGDGERVFVVLDPDVRNPAAVPIQAGTTATMIGLVRASPPEDVAIKQWAIDPGTARAVREHGTYLHVTEIQPAA
jgi:hypothetical protein